MIVGIVTFTALFFLSGVIIILLSTNSIIHAKNGSSDIFSPLFVFTMVFIIGCGIGAILLYLNSTYPEDILTKALLYTIVFLVAFVSGLSTHIGDALAQSLPRLRADFSIKRLRFVTFLFLPTGVALHVFLLWKAGFRGFIEVLENLVVFRRFWSLYGWAYVMVLSSYLIQAPFWGWILKRDNPIKFNLALSLYFVFVLAISLLSGYSGPTLVVPLSLLFIYHCKYKKISLFKALLLALGFLIPISAFYEIQHTYRGIDTEIRQVVQIGQNLDILKTLLSFMGRFIDAFGGFADILLHSHRLNLLWGASFYDALFLPIPRAFMPDKPYQFNMQMLKEIHPELFRQYGVEFSIMGELYMNFHLAGLIIGGFALGIIIKIMQKYYINNQTNISFLFLYRPFVLLPLAWYASGLINSDATIELFLNLFFAFVFFMFVWPKKL